MHIDFKVTTWERVEILEEKKEHVLKLLKEGKVSCSNDLYNEQSESEGYTNYNCELLIDTSEQMSVEENKGSSTIEVWEQVAINNKKPMQCTWQNGE